ncbi:MAG: SIMPL domain-containing protein [Alphaproteobacteria bacterium]|nr:SIMPL domain-containing protein [Alphaproteobacteria bacterium]
MDKKQKIFLAAIICTFGLALFAINRFSAPDTISVGGECSVSVPKDRTAVTLRVTALDKRADKSMKIVSEQIAQMNEFLKTQDVKVQTSEFNSYEKTEWNRLTEKSETVGVETTIALDVSADSTEKIEKVLSVYAGQPHVFVTNLRMFTSAEKTAQAVESCLGKAVENARTRANDLASGDKRRAGKMMAVSYSSNSSYNVSPMANFRVMKAAMAMDTEESYSGAGVGALVGKDTEVSVKVSAVFEIR